MRRRHSVTSDRQWERIAQTDPIWGVMSIDALRAENRTDAAEQRFWESGEEHIGRMLEIAEELVGPVDLRGTAVDFGCGVGRLLVPLGRRFARAVGIDVAASMREHARASCTRAGLENIELHESPARLSDVAFVHSTLVLQHIPVGKGRPLFDELVGVLRPGGVGVIQVPIARTGHRLRGFVRDMQGRVPGVRPLLNVVRGQPASEPHMQMNIYELGPLVRSLHERGAAVVALADLRDDGEFLHGTLVFRVPDGSLTPAT